MRQAGYTLVEIAVVVLIAAVLAAAVIRSQTSVDVDQTLDAAAEEVAAALRFARSEAIRTAEPYGVMGSTPSQLLRIYRLLPDGSTDYTIRHPVDRKLYHLDFDDDPMLEPVTLVTAAFRYEGDFWPQQFCGFLAATGTPKTTDAGVTRMLDWGFILLSAGGQTRTVSVAPMTGRVTIQ